MLALLFVVASISLTACGDDGNDNDEPEVPTTWSTRYAVTITLTADYLKVADITAHILHPDGIVTHEAVTKTASTWTMTGSKLPDQAGVMLTFVPKAEIDADASYVLGVNGGITASSIKDGETFSTKSTSLSHSLPVQGSRVAEYLSKQHICLSKGVDANGSVIDIKSSDIDFGVDTTNN